MDNLSYSQRFSTGGQMNVPFHAGELAIQQQAGVQHNAGRIARGIRDFIPPDWGDFLREQSMAGVGSLDTTGRVWASILIDKPGFLNTINPQTLQIESNPINGDPLARNLQQGNPLGLVAINLATRERMRINGQTNWTMQGQLQLTVEQAFANCPKYIQVRQVDPASPGSSVLPVVIRTTALTPLQQAHITQADTFFIATAHTERGVDVSHRGGNPGFVHIINNSLLEFPDYSGNMMFQTLGNLATNPNAGLIFMGFEQGFTLQLTGRASISWDESRTSLYNGAERVVTFEVDEVVEIVNALPAHFRLLQRSPYNPV